MRQTRSFRASFIVATTALLVPADLAALKAQVLILRAVGPSAPRLRAGQVVPANTAFALERGDKLSILWNGKSRTFTGPGSFAANAPPTNEERLRTVLQPRSDVGGSRILPGIVLPLEQPHPPNAWLLNVGSGGPVCAPRNAALPLWRPPATSANEITITASGEAPVTVPWRNDSPMLAWPAAVPIAEGKTYQLQWQRRPFPATTITFRFVADPGAELEKVAMTFIQKGCESQLNTLMALTSYVPP